MSTVIVQEGTRTVVIEQGRRGLTGTTNASEITSGTLALARGGTGASLADPNADRILFWDDSASTTAFLSIGTGLSISGTTLNGTAASAWGTITGTLSDQTDLQSALDLKANTSALPTAANPTAAGVGLTAINGSAATFMRSDGAPALDVSIAPTWTGKHTWTPSGTTNYLQVGTIATNSVDPAINIGRDITSGTGNSHAFSDSTNFARPVNGTAYNSFDARITIGGTADLDHYAALQVAPVSTNTGTMSNFYGLYSAWTASAGTVTNSYGVYVAPHSLTGSAAVTNRYGIFIGSGAGTSSTWAIYSPGPGNTQLGGKLAIGGASIGSEALTVTGVARFSGQVYADQPGGGIRVKADGTNSLDGMFYADVSGNHYLSNYTGTRGLKVTAAGNIETIASGNNLGINTTAPTAQVQITSSTAGKTALLFKSADSTTQTMVSGRRADNTEMFAIAANGAAIFGGGASSATASQIVMYSSGVMGFSSAGATGFATTCDTSFHRAAANVFRVGNGSTGAGSLIIGTSSHSIGTSGVGVLAIGNGTAPSTSPANTIQIYAESGEAKVRDAAGNITTFSPHNFSAIPGGPSEPMAWAYHSKCDDRTINVDMLRVVRLLEQMTGEQLVFIEE
jgi:hypothetical protein